MSTTDSYTFPDIQLVETDAAAIAEEMTQDYEMETGRDLSPADPIRQLILWMAAHLAQERSYIDIAAKRNLPRYAMLEEDEEYLDSLSELFHDVVRKEATPATVTLQFSANEAAEEDVYIPEGTEVTADGSQFFLTTEDAVIPAGSLTVEVDAECTEDGEGGNGYAAGKITTIMDSIDGVDTVTNITASSGGTDRETNGELYGRGRGSYETYSTAGTVGAYEFHVKDHNSAVADVKAYNIEAGIVGIRMLMETGLPTAGELEEMQDYISSDEIRAMGDKVIVFAPDAVEYSINLTYYGAERPEPGGALLTELMRSAAEEYVQWQGEKLGRRIDPGELSHLLYQAGAGRVVVHSPEGTEVKATECAVLVGEPVLTYGGED